LRTKAHEGCSTVNNRSESAVLSNDKEKNDNTGYEEMGSTYSTKSVFLNKDVLKVNVRKRIWDYFYMSYESLKASLLCNIECDYQEDVSVIILQNAYVTLSG
jgi:hypothetical protein